MFPVLLILVLAGICKMKKLKVLISVLDIDVPSRIKPFWVNTYSERLHQNRRQYAEKHGYDYFVGDKNLTPGNNMIWSKFVYNLQKLEEGYDLILNIDADAWIMNYNISIEELDIKMQNQCGDYSAAMTKDIKGFNAGVYLLKNTPETKGILNEALKLKSDQSVPRINDLFEQAGFAQVVEKNPLFKSKVCVAPQNAFNSYPYNEAYAGKAYTKGDFIRHFVHTGKQAMGYYLDKTMRFKHKRLVE